ncbi:MAG: hypothetical protein DBX59_09245 [Bacillota bacterium]|nr:MAG: hypothetical protein DBX59_09245 [Bacillota bacterium]
MTRIINDMIIIFIRTTAIFITLMVVMRLMGKRQIGEMQPFEFIITLIIADLACIPMADVSIPLVYGIVAILALFLLHQLIFLLENCGTFAKKVISGKPSVVLNKNGVNMKELKKNNLGVEDLLESMRAQGYFSLDDLDYAIFEANGNLSALEKADKSNRAALAVLLVSDGRLNKPAAEKTGVGTQFVTDFLRRENASLKDVSVMTVDNTGKIYFQRKNRRYAIRNVPLPEGAKW